MAKRLSTTIVTAPLVFLGLGYLLFQVGLVPVESTQSVLHVVAEIALVILLFLDAAQVDQPALWKRNIWPRRMLLIGLPVGFLLGIGFGWLLLPGWPLAVIAVVAAILVPTDAALGQPVISNPAVPERSRRGLSVESGLNDGLALPLVLMMAAFAAPQAMAPDGGWLVFTLKQIILGPLVGIVVGCSGAVVLLWAKRINWTSEIYEGIGVLALAATAFLAAGSVGGNGFIAAFSAGLGFGAIVKGKCAFVFEFTDSEGQFVSWTAFFLLGAVLVPTAVPHLTPQILLLILASLFIVRPLAIWISLMATDATPSTRLFFGWFGPRGLATALFALLVYEQIDPIFGEQVLHLAVNAVWISAVLHGVSAAPGAHWYASHIATKGASPETRKTDR